MPEVFNNYYAFPAGAVPEAEAFRDRLATQFGQALEMEKQERGFHGAPRAYACLRNEQMQIWIYWEPDRPDVEVGVDEPMERMIFINAAMVSLGGRPRYPDLSWKARRRHRTQRLVLRLVVIACFLALSATSIWHLHWWGLLLVIATIVTVACLYTIGLARAFSNR